MKNLFEFSSIFFLVVLFSISTVFAQKVGPKKGALVIVGGGNIPAAISDKFIELAGGKDANFVYVPTALEDENQKDQKTIFGLKNITVLHTRDRKVADTKEFVAALRKANGVWFGGGRQWRLVDSYLDTLFQKELFNLLKRGGVIGGSSAGATIQGSYLVRGAREGNTIMMAKGYEQGFGFLQNVAIDQHIDTRKREADLQTVITAYPKLLGIGISESTAIIVQKDLFSIIGKGNVAITDGKTYDGKPYYFLKEGDIFDLSKRKKK
ncbi:MAG TPA: cyanophycinase [Pyrinomonadaceae bacterium]|nr:cyanophycinase [Pyrinomonadaceae bacterium]